MGTANNQNFIHLSIEEKTALISGFIGSRRKNQALWIAEELDDFCLVDLMSLRDSLAEIVRATKKRKCA